jgi:hypothetical protein
MLLRVFMLAVKSSVKKNKSSWWTKDVKKFKKYCSTIQLDI